jgi:hypothetical protein
MTALWRNPLVACVLLLPLLCCSSTFSQQTAAFKSPASQELSTLDVGDHRFIAAHGRRSLVAGYASGDLEIWCYPFQILSGYRVSFLPEGQTTPIDGRRIVRRVVYHPDSVTRIYLGPGFVVREKLFVPLDRQAAILTYTVQAAHPVDIVIHAAPVLNLMWPGGLGGQATAWHNELSAYVLSEPELGYSAVAGSPQIALHDEPDNSTEPASKEAGIGFTLRPVSGFAQVSTLPTQPITDQRIGSSSAMPGNLKQSYRSIWSNTGRPFRIFKHRTNASIKLSRGRSSHSIRHGCAIPILAAELLRDMVLRAGSGVPNTIGSLPAMGW